MRASAITENEATLRVGGRSTHQRPTVGLKDLEAEDIGLSTYREVVLEVPLEGLSDAWLVLRRLYSLVARDGVLTAHYGVASDDTRFDSHTATCLFRLAGFEPVWDGPLKRGRTIRGKRAGRQARSLSCSVIVPCRNEVGNVDAVVQRLPRLGTSTELIFVDGSSTDGTPERVESLIASHPEREIRLLRQTGNRGKIDASFEGFDAATGDVVMILDADLTVAPEDLPRFYFALAEGVCGFANGTRFSYPMEAGAMPHPNQLGNRVFAVALSWVLGEKVSDTLCGTKALLRDDWTRLRQVVDLFGRHDPWGDFDLLLGAAHLGLPILDVPVPYAARVSGESKMEALPGGTRLVRATYTGARVLRLGRR